MARLAAWIGRRSLKEKVTLVAIPVIVTVALGVLLPLGEDSGGDAGPPPPASPKSGAAKWSDEIVAPYKKSKRDVYLESMASCRIANAFVAQPDAVALDYVKGEHYPPVFEHPAFEGCHAGLKADG